MQTRSTRHPSSRRSESKTCAPLSSSNTNCQMQTTTPSVGPSTCPKVVKRQSPMGVVRKECTSASSVTGPITVWALAERQQPQRPETLGGSFTAREAMKQTQMNLRIERMTRKLARSLRFMMPLLSRQHLRQIQTSL